MSDKETSANWRPGVSDKERKLASKKPLFITVDGLAAYRLKKFIVLVRYIPKPKQYRGG